MPGKSCTADRELVTTISTRTFPVLMHADSSSFIKQHTSAQGMSPTTGNVLCGCRGWRLSLPSPISPTRQADSPMFPRLLLPIRWTARGTKVNLLGLLQGGPLEGCL
ncbi:hypothetical protein E2C01_049394 [Portunus trituberculatus]|uniref:Uncharacterized protein n=1 Tax=Portunus trituberculatus TaxID=210409 RepID=A0A5B7GCZ1_PORTR|nr:hypothetical protein [Portunus trituberculatus]